MEEGEEGTAAGSETAPAAEASPDAAAPAPEPETTTAIAESSAPETEPGTMPGEKDPGAVGDGEAETD